MGHLTRLKKLHCDLCEQVEETEASRLDDGSRAILVPAGWRLVWRNGAIKFRCPKCWNEMTTGQFPVGEHRDSESSGDVSIVTSSS